MEPQKLNILRLHNISSENLLPATLEISSDEIVCIKGSSGSGKTLLLKCIVDLIESQGNAFLNGESRNRMPAHQWRKLVGYLTSNAAWWSDHVGDFFPNADETLFSKLNFGQEILEKRIDQCSTGERQRLALLRVLHNHPKVLLLDEPTANLDYKNTLAVESLVKDYQKENDVAVLWVSHDETQLKRIATRVFEIKSGELVAL